MSDFWSGALSALLGGVVGGAFTAIAAKFQVRATNRAAEIQAKASLDAAEKQVQTAFETATYQMKQAYQQQMQLMHGQLRQNITLEVAETLEELQKAAMRLTEGNPSQGHSCSTDEVLQFHDSASAKLYRFHWLYAGILPKQAAKVIDRLTDDEFGWSTDGIHSRAAASVEEAKRAGREAGTVCGYCNLANGWSEMLWQATLDVAATLSIPEGEALETA